MPDEPVLFDYERGLPPVTDDEAQAILARFIASHFRKPDREQALFRIPADPSHDDDLRMSRYIRETRALRAALAASPAPPAGDGVREAAEALLSGFPALRDPQTPAELGVRGDAIRVTVGQVRRLREALADASVAAKGGLLMTAAGIAQNAWTISLPFYGAFIFYGTEEEAEKMRAHKANWEREIARKRRATAEEVSRNEPILQKGDCGFEWKTTCMECRRPHAECRCRAEDDAAKGGR